jgi:hypothetical protein
MCSFVLQTFRSDTAFRNVTAWLWKLCWQPCSVCTVSLVLDTGPSPELHILRRSASPNRRAHEPGPEQPSRLLTLHVCSSHFQRSPVVGHKLYVAVPQFSENYRHVVSARRLRWGRKRGMPGGAIACGLVPDTSVSCSSFSSPRRSSMPDVA